MYERVWNKDSRVSREVLFVRRSVMDGMRWAGTKMVCRMSWGEGDFENGDIAQKTEDLVGPYLLHDFFLYYFLRYGFTPQKILMLARKAFSPSSAQCFDDETIEKWLKVFIRRFFSQQFKRSCLPDGPKVGSVSLSPRGDWRMPTDASSNLWLE